MTARKFDTFIFDLDGTLLDTLPDLTLLANRILREVGYPERSESEILSFVGNGVRRLMYQALPEGAPEEITDRAMQIWNDHFQEYFEHTHPYPGIVDVLQQLRARSVRIGVVSNKLQAGVDQIVSIRLPGMIDDMLGESPAVPRKPDPTGINMMVRSLQTTPEHTVYVGDSAGDMRAAHNAGLFAIAVRWGYNNPDNFADQGAQAIPDAIVNSAEELLAYAVD
ncbi:HAD family hydrolase [Adlercreutzia sp. ZJ304]|uniref:HAD family hydrolase n=1 Tax=Adlercreutzia sp. ZJ304 TaxID=2709791 RepID=UPI0013EA765D|nr:HAD family hydrolase [Adlercreutzia sp. ZJ304]